MKKFKAFTLAETMIVIVVLGIIATLTIPALVNKNKESVAKTKVRKAMAAYESALNKMIIENDLKSDTALNEWASAIQNCGNPSNYFKKVQGDGCIFKTSDGIWWNISDIERPLIAFNQDNLTIDKANNANDYSAFVLVGRFGNDGSLRVDDLAYETGTGHAESNSDKQVTKLYTFLGMKKASSGNTTPSPFAACNHADTCVVGGITYTKVTIERDRTESYDYCDPEDWDGVEGMCGEEDDKWKTKTSESKAGEYYMAIEGFPNDYETQAFNYEGSTCDLCQNDWESGDYYNAAKRHCETSGGRLPTIAELKSLHSQGKFPSQSWFWASEEYSPDTGYYVDSNGYVDYNIKDGNDVRVLCLGN